MHVLESSSGWLHCWLDLQPGGDDKLDEAYHIMTVIVFAFVAALVPQQAPPPHLSRRALLGVGAALGLSGVPHRAAAANDPQAAPPSAIILRLADSTATMEGMMMRSAEDVEQLTVQQRIDAGRPPIGRVEMRQSVEVMLQASKLASLPGGGDAASTLRGVGTIAAVGQGELSREEYVSMAKQYQRTRDELKKVFDALPAAEQEEGQQIVRQMRAAADARKRAAEDEQEALRQTRAKIAAEAPAAAEVPRRKKTLAELEAAQSASSFGKQQPVMSLYAQ